MDFRETLTLERLEVNLFRGLSPNPGGQRIFGGQVIAQALLAAYETVEDRVCHSLHCYFIHPGDPKIPIIFEVDRARDGRSFATRRVIAVQHGRQVFNLAASFQSLEPGLDHQSQMPEAVEPEGLPDLISFASVMDAELPDEQREQVRERPIQMRFIDVRAMSKPGGPPTSVRRTWFRIREPLGDDPRLHQAALAYASDMALLGASLGPHRVSWSTPGMQSASLDHAMWFHRPTDANAWHLYDMNSPSASGARGFNIGEIYRQDGTLTASCTQEGLIRLRQPR
jgi:acyl-CoA thioesterase-2